MDLQQQRNRAAQELPADPLIEKYSQKQSLRRWDIVLAYNLEHPFRFKQDYWWLEVLASTPLAARWVAWEWVRNSGETRFECTDWVRPSTPHLENTTIIGESLSLPIHWSVPLPEGWSLQTPVRHPASGRRLGFIVPADLPLMHPKPEGDYYLLRHLPASESPAVGLVPKVWDIHQLRISQDRQADGHTLYEPRQE